MCDATRQFMGRGVIIRTVINGMTFDGAATDPIAKAVRDALIAFMAATARATGRSDEGRSASLRRGSRDARQGDG
jgi:putative DNA-invertase from lambdoid prophage Rac